MYSIFSRKLEINLFGSPSSAYLWKPRQRQTPEFLNVKTRWLNVLMATICVRLFSVEMYLLLTNIFPITLSGWDFLSVGSYLTQNQVPVRDPWRVHPAGAWRPEVAEAFLPAVQPPVGSGCHWVKATELHALPHEVGSEHPPARERPPELLGFPNLGSTHPSAFGLQLVSWVSLEAHASSYLHLKIFF